MHFMLDLETYGTTPGCGILSIGLQAFDVDAYTAEDVFVDDGHYSVINRDDCLGTCMLHVDKDTMDWWARQGAEARKVLEQSQDPNQSITVSDALAEMVDYVSGHVAPSKARIWGNGADFDNPILAVAARHAGVALPWKWGNRCFRTLKTLHEDLFSELEPVPIERTGTYHNALDDARSQAVQMWAIVRDARVALRK